MDIGVKFHGLHQDIALQKAIIPTTYDKGQQGFHTMNIFNYLVPIAVGAVAVVLLLGLWNMMRGGSANRSQTLMRWRVLLQFAAIIIMMAGLWFANR
jgi:ABC-type nickel/cobalt efflux system permease component RcnA